MTGIQEDEDVYTAHESTSFGKGVRAEVKAGPYTAEEATIIAKKHGGRIVPDDEAESLYPKTVKASNEYWKTRG